MNSIAEKSLKNYLSTISHKGRDYAFLALDNDNIVVALGGAVERFAFKHIRLGDSARTQLPFLEGLLPCENSPIVIPDTQYLKNHFVDLHLFTDGYLQWILLLDNTKAGIRKQRNQQTRLDSDIVSEKQHDYCKARYFEATESLLKTITDPSEHWEDKLNRILSIGLIYFDLDSAIIRSVSGKKCKVISATGSGLASFEHGEYISIDNTLCGTLLNHKQIFSTHSISNSDLPASLSDCNDIQAECYLGAHVQTENGPFGFVSFFSKARRQKPFNETDEKILQLISTSIGNQLGNKEQLDFMQAQSANYKNLFETVPASLFLCDRDGLLIFVSEVLSDQTGIAGDELPGRMCFDLFDIDSRPNILEAIRNGQGSNVVAMLQRQDARPLEVELNIKVKKLGPMSGIRMVIASDVSARNQAHREITEQNVLLSKANESLEQFTYMASHDLQAPLRKIREFCDILVHDLDEQLDDEHRYSFNVIVNSSEKMSVLISDLLDYSHIRTAKQENEAINLNTLLEDIVAELDSSIKEIDTTVSVEALPTVQGNRTMLTQLFDNLLANAIKYRKIGRKTSVKITAVNVYSGIQLTVSDNGIGFNTKYADQIFEPFKRLHTADNYKGTGIGLAICKSVCDKHGWTISANSKTGQGTTFTIGIPST